MIGICLESSHARGMGHLYRMLALADMLERAGEPFVFMMNSDPKALEVIARKGFDAVPVDLADMESGWEGALIQRLGITIWVNDRLHTQARHAENVTVCGVKLVTFDDRGAGAVHADLHFAPLLFNEAEQLRGKRIYTGPDYLLLNKDIDRFRRQRKEITSVVVTLGGSDTYGVTLKVLPLVQRWHLPVTVITGPSFQHYEGLEGIIDKSVQVKQGVPSLIEEFAKHDLAVTGGGVTAFETGASGLPCIVVANELHEIETGLYLEKMGTSVFAGYHEAIKSETFNLERMDIGSMSYKGMAALNTGGAARILEKMLAL